MHIPKTELLMLFHYDKDQPLSSHNAITPWAQLGFFTAKRLIMREWITKDPPRLVDWEAEMKKLLYLEKLKAKLNRDMLTASFTKRWKTFIEAVLPRSEKNALMSTF